MLQFHSIYWLKNKTSYIVRIFYNLSHQNYLVRGGTIIVNLYHLYVTVTFSAFWCAKPAHAAHAALARVRGTYVMGVISRDELLESCRSCAEGVDNGEEIRNCVPDASREAHPVSVRFTEGVLEEGEKPAGSR